MSSCLVCLVTYDYVTALSYLPWHLNHHSISESFHHKASMLVFLFPLFSYDCAEHVLFLFNSISTLLLSFWTFSFTYSRDSSLLLLRARMLSSICQLHLSRYKYRDKQGCLPLHYSVQRGCERETRLLMNEGADVTAVQTENSHKYTIKALDDKELMGFCFF